MSEPPQGTPWARLSWRPEFPRAADAAVDVTSAAGLNLDLLVFEALRISSSIPQAGRDVVSQHAW